MADRWTWVAAGLIAPALALGARPAEGQDRQEPPIALASANAQATPSPSPSQPTPAPVLRIVPNDLPPAADMGWLGAGMRAADSGDWPALMQARAQAADPLVKRILSWRHVSDRDAQLSFHELKRGLDEFVGWPGRETMRRRAELAIFDAGLSAASRLEFLQSDGGPLTGDGKVALALALRDAGRGREATEALRNAYRDSALSSRAASLAIAEFGSALTQADHAARADRALWRDDRATASSLRSRLSPEDRLLLDARIALQTRPRRGLQATVDRVPASRVDDPGLLYDRARYVRRDGRPEDALPIAARIDGAAAPPAARDTLFKERRLYIPRALKAGDARTAYNLAARHGLVSGENFADAEWLAGWIALRFLRDPATADRHFEKLGGSVSAPVSKARAHYWRAMSLKALGQDAAAAASLQEAAALNFTYYGQIAASKLGAGASIAFAPRQPITREVRQEFESRDVVRALKLIAEVGDRDDFESIAFYLDDHLQSPLEHEILSLMARERAFTRTSVRTAKSGLRRGVVAAEAAYPLLDLPADARKPGRPEPALVLAITRQETEFDPRAVSSAGARGLMQLMPATARATAKRENLPYQPAWLLDDPSYNLTLGAAHLQHLLEDWNGSYILTIASYNAGAGRAREWIEDWGDPRSASVDPIDWVELIPFSETRNYVQRVLENVQVYRHRITSMPAPIQIEKDLRRGG